MRFPSHSKVYRLPQLNFASNDEAYAWAVVEFEDQDVQLDRVAVAGQQRWRRSPLFRIQESREHWCG